MVYILVCMTGLGVRLFYFFTFFSSFLRYQLKFGLHLHGKKIYESNKTDLDKHKRSNVFSNT